MVDVKLQEVMTRLQCGQFCAPEFTSIVKLRAVNVGTKTLGFSLLMWTTFLVSLGCLLSPWRGKCTSSATYPTGIESQNESERTLVAFEYGHYEDWILKIILDQFPTSSKTDKSAKNRPKIDGQKTGSKEELSPGLKTGKAIPATYATVGEHHGGGANLAIDVASMEVYADHRTVTAVPAGLTDTVPDRLPLPNPRESNHSNQEVKPKRSRGRPRKEQSTEVAEANAMHRSTLILKRKGGFNDGDATSRLEKKH